MATSLCGLKLSKDQVVTLNFVTDRTMTQVNEDFLGHEGTTDVISFCYLENEEPLMPDDTVIELVICADTAMREGTARPDSTYAEELVLYIVHGLLHAAGEDDLTPEPRRRMRQREAEVMSALKEKFIFEEIFPIEKCK
jgi:probable rRNA maturation factor